jgi:ankyrin repeat protein
MDRAVYMAVHKQEFGNVFGLIASGVSPSFQREADGLTPLMAAGAFGDLETVQRLLKLGADPTARDRKGRTAADHAVMKKRPPAIAKALADAYWEKKRDV